MAGLAKVGKFLVKNRAAIGFGVGTVTGVAALVETIRKSRKAVDIIDEHKASIAEVRETHKLNERSKKDMTKEERKAYDSDRFKVYWTTGKKLGKNYAFAFSLSACSFVSYRYSYKVQAKLLVETEKKLAVATAAASAWAKKYNDYRSEVIERYGEQADFDILNHINDGWEEVGKGKNKQEVKTYSAYSENVPWTFDMKKGNFQPFDHDMNVATIQAFIMSAQEKLDAGKVDGWLIKDLVLAITSFDNVTTPMDWEYLGYAPGDIIEYELKFDEDVAMANRIKATNFAPEITMIFKNPTPVLTKIRPDDKMAESLQECYINLKEEQRLKADEIFTAIIDERAILNDEEVSA